MLHGLSTRSHILRLETPYIQKSAVEITAWACLASTWSWWCPRSQHEPIAAEYRPNLLSHFCFHCSPCLCTSSTTQTKTKAHSLISAKVVRFLCGVWSSACCVLVCLPARLFVFSFLFPVHKYTHLCIDVAADAAGFKKTGEDWQHVGKVSYSYAGNINPRP